MRHVWQEPEKAFMREVYPWHTPDEMARMLKERFGITVSGAAVRNQAGVLGVAGEVPPGWYSLVETGEILGVCHKALRQQVRRGDIRAKKASRVWVISETELDRLIARYLPELPWPAVGIDQATKMLGYATRWPVHRAVQLGHLESVRIGPRRWIRRSDIDRACAYLAKTGFVQVPWQRLKVG
jgi:hypothetical protein